MSDKWDDDMRNIIRNEHDYRYQQDLMDLMNQAQAQAQVSRPVAPAPEIPTISKLAKELAKELKEAKALFDELTAQKEFANDPLIFLYAYDEDLDEMQEWCFDNDLIFKIETHEMLDAEVSAIIFKTEEDAMAFKLRWQ